MKVSDARQKLEQVGNELSALQDEIKELEARPLHGAEAARRVTRLATLRDKETELAKKAAKAEKALADAQAQEQQEADKVRADKAPAIKEALSRKEQADNRIDAAMTELAEAMAASDAAADELYRLTGSDGAKACQRMKHARPFTAGLHHAGIARRFGISMIGVDGERYADVSRKLRESIEAVAQRYEGEQEAA